MSFTTDPVPEAPTANGTHTPASAAEPELTHPTVLNERTVPADLASWLVARELLDAEGPADADGSPIAAERACQKLSHGLSRSISPAGSQALMSRALHVVRAEFPFLDGVCVSIAPGACFEGLTEATRDVEAVETTRGLLAVLGCLLDLLVKYIGEALTLRVVWEVWPDLPLVALSEPRDADGQQAVA